MRCTECHFSSFVRSFIHSFVPSFVHSFIHSFFLSFIHSFIHSFIYSFIQLCSVYSVLNSHMLVSLDVLQESEIKDILDWLRSLDQRVVRTQSSLSCTTNRCS